MIFQRLIYFCCCSLYILFFQWGHIKNETSEDKLNKNDKEKELKIKSDHSKDMMAVLMKNEPGIKNVADMKNEPENKMAGDMKNEPVNRMAGDMKNEPVNSMAGDMKNEPGNKISAEMKNEMGNKMSGDMKNEPGNQISADLKNNPGNKMSADMKNELGNKIAADMKNEPQIKMSVYMKKEPGNKMSADMKNNPGNKMSADMNNELGNKIAADMKKEPGIKMSVDMKNEPGKKPGNKIAADVKDEPGMRMSMDMKNKSGNKMSADKRNEPDNKKTVDRKSISRKDCRMLNHDSSVFHSYNIFSILEFEGDIVEESSSTDVEEDILPVVEILTSSDLKKNTQKCQKKRRKGNRKKLEVVKRANTPQCSKGIFPTVTRCAQCFVNHFPHSKFCKWTTKLAILPDNVHKMRITILSYLANKKIQKPPKPERKQFKIYDNVLSLIEDKTLFLETMLNCGYSVQDLYASSTDFKPIRLRGGANKDNNEGVTMVKKVIESAKKHGIHLKHQSSIASDGNCSFESAIQNVNNRQCFKSKVPFSATASRKIWITDLENLDWKYPELVGGYTKSQRDSNWNLLKQSGVYEIDFFGDMMMHAIARGCHKNILIFNTSPDAQDPIYVVKAEQFGGYLDSDIPIVLGYNQYHFESFHPITDTDIEKTKSLVLKYVNGLYQFSKKDIPFLCEAKHMENEIGKHVEKKQEATAKEILEIQVQAEWELGRKLNEKEMFNFLNFVPAKQFLLKLQRVI